MYVRISGAPGKNNSESVDGGSPGDMSKAMMHSTCARRKFLSVDDISCKSWKTFAKTLVCSPAEKSISVRLWWPCLSCFDMLAVAQACESKGAASSLAMVESAFFERGGAFFDIAGSKETD